MDFGFSKLNYYCFNRLKLDELGLVSTLDDIIANDLYEQFYLTIDFESEKLYTVNELILVKTNWFKALRNFRDMVDTCLGNLNGQTGWHQMVTLATVTKMFVRRYRPTNPLFASMFCIEFLERLNEFDDSNFIAWKRVSRQQKQTQALYKRRQLIASTVCFTTLGCLLRAVYSEYYS